MTKKNFYILEANVDYFDPSTTLTDEEDKLFKLWNLEIEKKLFISRKTYEWKGQKCFRGLNKRIFT